MLKIYLTNLGKYNEGYLVGEWVELPITDDELEEIKKRIGITEKPDEFGCVYEEMFITDYETDVIGLEVEEFDTIEILNEIAEQLEKFDEYDAEIIGAIMSEGYSFDEAIDKMDDCIIWSDCSDMTDVAERYCDECCILEGIPEHLRNYFVFEAFGRDMSFEGTFIFTDNGNCIELR